MGLPGASGELWGGSQTARDEGVGEWEEVEAEPEDRCAAPELQQQKEGEIGCLVLSCPLPTSGFRTDRNHWQDCVLNERYESDLKQGSDNTVLTIREVR